MYDALREFKESLRLLKLALADYAEKFNTTEVGLRLHPSGAWTIDVNGEYEEYFFNAEDLVEWLKENYGSDMSEA